MVQKRWLAAVAAVGVVLAGCGGDDNEDSANTGGSTGTSTAQKTAPAGKAAKTVKVSEVDFKLKPATVTIDKPGTVKFVATNDGNAPHALEVEGPTGEQETKTLSSGESGSITVDLSKPGRYEMYCPVSNHKELGMDGAVVVRGSSASAGQAAKTEDNPKPDDSGGAGY